MKIVQVLDTYTPQSISYPYIIAEAGVNHEGSMDTAKRLIDEAAKSGAQAIKFQTYKAETIASKDSPSYWDLSKEPTRSQFELFKKYDKFWKSEYEDLKNYCDEADIEFLSTPFDIEAATFLNDLMPVFKISSSDITNLPFIEFICKFKKPILLSTGASYPEEITEAVEVIQKYKLPYCLMHCILNYPTEDKNANLGMILDLRRRFPNAIPGYSDHTLPKGMESLKIATLLGAVVLEKHFTYDKTLPGNDHYHAMDKNDLAAFVSSLKDIFLKLGSSTKTVLESEQLSRKNARRSLVAKRNIKKGTKISAEDLTWKRPATGISPKEIKKVLGREAVVDILEDQILHWNQLS